MTKLFSCGQNNLVFTLGAKISAAASPPTALNDNSLSLGGFDATGWDRPALPLPCATWMYRRDAPDRILDEMAVALATVAWPGAGHATPLTLLSHELPLYPHQRRQARRAGGATGAGGPAGDGGRLPHQDLPLKRALALTRSSPASPCSSFCARPSGSPSSSGWGRCF